MGRKVLYLTYDGLTDPLGQSQVLPYILGLTEAGHSFTIISFEKEKYFADLENNITSICNSHGIQWIPLAYHKTPPVISTVYDISRLTILVKRICCERNVEIVHCRSYLTSLVGLTAKRKWGTKFVFDMRGFWADERVEGGLWNLFNPVFKTIYAYFKKKEREFLTEADFIISLTNNAKKEIESWPIKSAPITVIPTCVDLELFDPNKIDEDDKVRLREGLGIQRDDYVLLYLGSWGTWYLIEEMLAFFGKLKKQVPKSKFLIITADNVDLTNYPFQKDVIITRSARATVPLHISLANASLCFVKPTFSKKASSATKMGELMAMQVPVICNSGWGDVEAYRGKILIYNETDNFEEITKKISTLSNKVNDLSMLSLTEGIIAYQRVYENI